MTLVLRWWWVVNATPRHIPNAFIINGPHLMKWCTEIITLWDELIKLGHTAAVIFAPSKHLQYDLHSSHMAGCKQAAGTKCRKVVIRLCKGKEAHYTNFDMWERITVSNCTIHVNWLSLYIHLQSGFHSQWLRVALSVGSQRMDRGQK